MPGIELPYVVVVSEVNGEWFREVFHQPSGLCLGEFGSLELADWVAAVLNWADAMPLVPTEYDGSQWESDPA